MRETYGRMLMEAERAFDGGDLIATLPIHFDWQPSAWSAEEVAWARVLARSKRADENGRAFAGENGYPVEPGDSPHHRPEDAAAFEAWIAPLDLLLESAPGLASRPVHDFSLSTLVNGWCAWDADYSVLRLTDRVAVLTIDGLGDLYPRFPMPSLLLDRSRLLPAVADALGSTVDWFGTPFAELHCSHSAADLYRVLLVASGSAGPEVWETEDAGFLGHRLPLAEWGFDDLRALLGEVVGKEG